MIWADSQYSGLPKFGISAAMKMAEIPGLLDAVGATGTELARFMRVDPKVIYRILNGERRSLRQSEVDQISAFLKLRENPVYDLPDDRSEILPGNELRAAGRVDIPLFGSVDTRSGPAIALARDTEVGRVMPHPLQMSAKRPIAVEIVDESMAPRYRPGEIAYVSLGKTVAKGQDCLVEFADKTARVLEYVERSERQWIFRQLNPAKEIIRPASEKISVHLIVGRG